MMQSAGATALDAIGMEVLDPDECHRLIGRHGVGRVAVVVDGQPLIFPVNYVADRRAILFRTAEGTKYAAAPMTRVAFEVDGEDGGDAGSPARVWSVMVTGDAHDVTDALDLFAQDLRRLDPRPAVAGERNLFIEIYIRDITGRRFDRARPHLA